MYFEQNSYLYLLGIIPVFIVLWLLNQKRLSNITASIGETWLVKRIAIASPLYLQITKYLLYLIAVLLLIASLARPYILGIDEQTKNMSPTDVVFVVDVSKSMYVKDVAPDRLSRAKRLMKDILDQLTSEQVGVVVFAGKANTFIPLTNDYYYASKAIDGVSADLVSEKGTSLRQALKISSLIYSPKEKRTKVMCLISDGEFHDDNVISLADTIRRSGINMFTFGFGTPKGGEVPLTTSAYNDETERGADNQAIISQLHPEMLFKIAGNKPGNYIQVADKFNAASLFVQQLKRVEYNDVVKSPKQFFGLFLLVAFIILVLETCIPQIIKPVKISEL